MIIGKFYNGSGLGNMLHRYIATRVRALDLGVDYRMIYIDDGAGKEQGFKGKFFLNQPNIIPVDDHELQVKIYSKLLKSWDEKKVRDANGVDISPFDPEFFFIEDNTIIDGEMQSSAYWEHREKEVDKWLKVEPLEVPDDTCVVGFRGGEFALYPDLFLTKEYYEEAMNLMIEKYGVKRFKVHTDDEVLAKEFFGDIPVIHNIGTNWGSMRYAKHAIIANSSFFILPRWLRNGITISPRYWGRHNTKIWSLPQNYYKRFKYI